MADWLNVTLAGPYSLTVTRDGDVVDPEAIGASLTVSNGVITLETPNETHIWGVSVTPSNLPLSKFRMSSWDFSDTISAGLATNGTESSPLVPGPPVSPDPVTFTVPAASCTMFVTELS